MLIGSYYVFQWYEGVNASVKDRYEAKAMHLKKQLEKIADKDVIRARLDKAKEELNGFEKGLLSGDKPPVAAAELQKLLKETAMSLNVEIKSERISTPVDAGLYLEIRLRLALLRRLQN